MKISFRHRLTASYALVAALALAATIAYLQPRLRENARAQLQRSLTSTRSS